MKTVLARIVLLAVFGVPMQTATATAQSLVERNKALADRYHLEVIQAGNLELASELFTPNAAIHNGTQGEFTGPEGARQIARNDARVFPKGMTFVHDNHVAEGNLVAFRWTLIGIMASGAEAVVEGLDLLRVENGKVAELWIEYHSVDGQ